MPGSPNGIVPSPNRALVLVASMLVLFLAACGSEPIENEVATTRPDARQSGDAAVAGSPTGGVEVSRDEDEPWRAEMARDVGIPAGPITIHELSGRVAFASTRNGPHTVFKQELRSDAEPERLGYGFEPAWSPDGQTIAFTGSYLETGDEIAVMNADGSNVRQLTSADGQDRGPTWSPDGRTIAFWSERDDREREIYVVSAEDGSERRLTNDSFADLWPSWSPHGNEIAYESYRGDGAELFAVSPHGGTPRRITPKGLDARDPAWSPDASQIAFVSSTDRGWALALIAADGTRVRKLAEMKGVRNPAWSPDGRFIIFACTLPTIPNEDICIVDAAGERMLNLTNDGDGFDWEPAWTR